MMAGSSRRQVSCSKPVDLNLVSRLELGSGVLHHESRK
jgi:hypothetical protein